MASLPTYRVIQNYRLKICYFWRNISTCERTFCSKNNSDATTDVLNETNKTENQKSFKQDEKIGRPDNLASEKKEAAKKKLFSLLSEIKVSPENSKIRPDLILAKPIKRLSKAERLKELQAKQITPEKEMKMAVSAVAKSIDGDLEKTEMELHEKLSSLNLIPGESDSKTFTENNIDIDENMQENIMSSVKDIASTVPSPVSSKLTQRLLRMSVEKKGETSQKISIENMVKGMKIEKKKTTKPTRTDTLEMMPKERKHFRAAQTKINIFQSAPLDIFSTEDIETDNDTISHVWQSLEKKQLKLLTEFAPTNAFEEMIMWTEQGKHWKFPIDNETEMGDEENVGFHEHVFLEHHLEGFPTKGPVRHFMELVCVGLSKNPYITVERKIENINWFRDYFKEKEDILREYGAI